MGYILNFEDFEHLRLIKESIDEHGLIAESLSNEVDKNLKIGIVIATHKIDNSRSDYMSTPEVLKECLESIKSQSFPNWKVFIVADCYEGDEEIKEVMESCIKGKYEYHNLSKPGERNLNIPTNEKKITGGTSAWNKGLAMAEAAGMDVIAKVDHDDKWKNNHLMSLAKAYTQYPEAAFVFTKAAKKPIGGGTSKRILYYPNKATVKTVTEDNHFAKGGDTSHSAISWRLLPGIKGVRYRGAADQKSSEPKRSEVIPVDADIYSLIKLRIEDKGYKYVYVPELTSLYRNAEGQFPNR
jgi:glycosyltransferase involved in cell wall biosynthesis